MLEVETAGISSTKCTRVLITYNCQEYDQCGNWCEGQSFYDFFDSGVGVGVNTLFAGSYLKPRSDFTRCLRAHSAIKLRV